MCGLLWTTKSFGQLGLSIRTSCTELSIPLLCSSIFFLFPGVFETALLSDCFLFTRKKIKIITSHTCYEHAIKPFIKEYKYTIHLKVIKVFYSRGTIISTVSTVSTVCNTRYHETRANEKRIFNASTKANCQITVS